MDDAHLSEARKAFVADLRSIRESRQVTLLRVYEDTRIPMSTLREFETSGHFNNPLFNRVYLRSFAMTYARSVGIPTRLMAKALTDALENTYDGELRRHFFGIGASEWADTLPTAAPSEIPELPEIVVATEPEAVVVNAPLPTTVPPRRRTATWERSGGGSWKWMGAGLLAVAALALLLWPEEPPPVEEAAPDPILEATPPPEPARLGLGRPFHVILHPVERLERVRVRIDDGLRRPYWIEQGKTTAIEIQDSLRIERRLARMRLFVGDLEIPLEAVTEGEAATISRAWLEENAGNLPEASVPVPVDTLRVQGPAASRSAPASGASSPSAATTTVGGNGSVR